MSFDVAFGAVVHSYTVINWCCGYFFLLWLYWYLFIQLAEIQHPYCRLDRMRATPLSLNCDRSPWLGCYSASDKSGSLLELIMGYLVSIYLTAKF